MDADRSGLVDFNEWLDSMDPVSLTLANELTGIIMWLTH